MHLSKLVVVLGLFSLGFVLSGCRPTQVGPDSSVASPANSPLANSDSLSFSPHAVSEEVLSFVKSRRPLAIFVSPVEAAGSTQNLYLVDMHGEPYYINKNESDGKPECDEACQETWVPVKFKWEEPVVSVPATHYDIDTIELEDGFHQARYKGYPLYWAYGDVPEDSLSAAWQKAETSL